MTYSYINYNDGDFDLLIIFIILTVILTCIRDHYYYNKL